MQDSPSSHNLQVQSLNTSQSFLPSDSAAPQDQLTSTIQQILDKIQRALKLKGQKKAASNTQASLLLSEITSDLWTIPDMLSEQLSTSTAMAAASTSAALQDLTSDYNALYDKYKNLGLRYNALLTDYSTLSTSVANKSTSQASPSLAADLDSRMQQGFQTMEHTLKNLHHPYKVLNNHQRHLLLRHTPQQTMAPS